MTDFLSSEFELFDILIFVSTMQGAANFQLERIFAPLYRLLLQNEMTLFSFFILR